MTEYAPVILAIAILVALLALTSGKIKDGVDFLSEPLIALVAGAMLGPLGLAVLTTTPSHHGLEAIAEITVGLAVMAGVLRLPPKWVRAAWPDILIMIGPVMLAMWAASALVGWAFLPTAALVALVIGAAVTPTDPVLAGSILSSRLAERNVPSRLRFLITGEAAANDGLAMPFVLLSLYLLTGSFQGVWPFLLDVVLWKVLGALAIGGAVGLLAGRAADLSEKVGWTNQTAMLGLSIALTAFGLMMGHLIGINGILAVFAAGLGLNQTLPRKDDEANEVFDEGAKRLFEQPVFFLLGMMLPLRGWLEIGWPLAAFCLGILALRRLPWVALAARFLRPIHARADMAFTGWFGPIGIAALYYALLTERRAGEPVIWEVVSAVIVASLIAHGLTATPAARKLPMAEHPPRHRA
jgi:NhaP-type Na+/H+ or K+/H+ antiporter